MSNPENQPIDNEPMDIVLGNGDKIVSTITNLEEGWAGFCISDSKGTVGIGEHIPQPEGTTDNSLGAYFRLRTKNVKSLEVVIDNCERAISYLREMEGNVPNTPENHPPL